MKVNVTCKVAQEVKEALEKEAKERSITLNGHLVNIIDIRHNNAPYSNDVHEADIKIHNEQKEKIDLLTKELEYEKSQRSNIEKGIPSLEKKASEQAYKLADHYAKRAYEIARISRDKLNEGL